MDDGPTAADPALADVRTRPARPRAEKRRPSLFWVLGAAAVPFVRGVARLRVPAAAGAADG